MKTDAAAGEVKKDAAAEKAAGKEKAKKKAKKKNAVKAPEETTETPAKQ